MKITSISAQTRNQNRVNVSVDGEYRFSLDAYQSIDLGVRVGREYDEVELVTLENESQFGKVYSRALEYCLMRLHSAREVKNYLYRKTRPTRDKKGDLKLGVSSEITDRVFDRLLSKGYIDDVKFTHYWVENRSVLKGVSRRKLTAELRVKGVPSLIIDQEFSLTERNDNEEIQKIIAKKRAHYPDDQKLMMYLARLGFSYDDIKQALNKTE
jgi:regulatory protein